MSNITKLVENIKSLRVRVEALERKDDHKEKVIEQLQEKVEKNRKRISNTQYLVDCQEGDNNNNCHWDY